MLPIFMFVAGVVASGFIEFVLTLLVLKTAGWVCLQRGTSTQGLTYLIISLIFDQAKEVVTPLTANGEQYPGLMHWRSSINGSGSKETQGRYR
jgi:hypothetical protein